MSTGIIARYVYAARVKLTGRARTAAKTSPNYDTFDPRNRRIIAPCGGSADSHERTDMTDPIMYENDDLDPILWDDFSFIPDSPILTQACHDVDVEDDTTAYPTHFERVQDAGYEAGDPKGYSVP